MLIELTKRFASTAGGWRAAHTRMTRQSSSADLGKTIKGGIEVLVANNPNHAWNELRQKCDDAKLRPLTRRYTRFIKPKLQRKLSADRVREQEKRTEFNRKLGIAIEMMQRERDV